MYNILITNVACADLWFPFFNHFLKIRSDSASLYEFGKQFHNKLPLKIKEFTPNLFVLHNLGKLESQF